MTKRDGMTFDEALKKDILEGGRGLNPGDRERVLAEHAEEQAKVKAQQTEAIERAVDAAIAKARAASEKGL